MPGSATAPGRRGARDGAPLRVAFRQIDDVGTRDVKDIAAQWLACTLPYRRFADILADASARLGADVVRYAFIVMDFHHLLLAGLPAHPFVFSLSIRSKVLTFRTKACIEFMPPLHRLPSGP
ncbi:hypothetical protein BN2475_170070 [Paraburkholderia ribeironis]|uniref:Uncharacterized protein n=1 Tax=Paraburkholderia ribeironis TaxID=1247936 RepID=A0A1N7RUQ1_9BURK|nr:hypothetical protein BN2475_170070 [Paraburkholderia ribeironis]